MGMKRTLGLAGVMPRRMVGARTETAAAALQVGGPFARAYAGDALCDECRHFEEAENRCAVQQTETTFDSRACRFFDRR